MSTCSGRLAAGAAAEMRLKQSPESYCVLLSSRIGMSRRRGSIAHRSTSSSSYSVTFEAAVPVASSAGIRRRKERRCFSSASSYAVRSNEVKDADRDENDESGEDDDFVAAAAVVPDDGDADVAEEGEGEKERKRRRRRKTEVVVAAAATVVLGVGNRVLYKLALVPLKRYPFFLAQLATFGYVIVYSSILYIRYRAGKVTDEMLSLPKTPFVAVGLLEALGAVSGMAAGAMLSGAAIPILSQSFLVWQLILSFIFLGRRYSLNQLLGCFLVAVGVVTTVASGSSAGSLMEAGVFWSFLMIISFLFQAADTVLKEIIFKEAAQKLKGGSVDLFVVNSYGSAFQAAFICLLLPFLSKLWGIPFFQLPSYIKDGAACFLNIGSISHECSGAPLLPLLFVAVNMGFNISLLHLLKISSAVVSCLVSTFSVPISVFLFTLPLPYIGVASFLPPGFLAGACILVVGMLIYAWRPSLTPSPAPLPVTAIPLLASE